MNKKQENPVIVSALKCHAALENKITDTTKKLKDVTNQLQVLKKSQKRLSETLLDSGNKKPKQKACSDCSAQIVLFNIRESKNIKLRKILKLHFHSLKMKILNFEC